MWRWLLTVVLLSVASLSAASAEIAPFHAGIARFSVPAAPPFDVLVWYPSDAAEVPWQAGPFLIPASRDAAMASGRFPIVLLSHGGGPTGGGPLVLREISSVLARQGFVVVAPFHVRTGLQARPRQVELAFQAVLADARFANHVDAKRPGMIGFSLGTAVALELAGAVPNIGHLIAYCGVHPDDVMSCKHSPDGIPVPTPGEALVARAQPPARSLPLQALVLLDPFAVLFQRDELTAVTMPVLMFRPERSELPGEANAFGLAAALPRPPRLQVVPGGHFIFTDICAAELRSSAPEICNDPPGVDRATVHTDIEGQIARFLRASL